MTADDDAPVYVLPPEHLGHGPHPPGWFAVVDDTRGGIVAYFGRGEDAEEYAALLHRPPLTPTPNTATPENNS